MTDKYTEIDGKFYQKAKVVMLPTEDNNPTTVPFVQVRKDGKIVRHAAGGEFRKYLSLGFKPQHLYFLSDEEIKEGHWLLANNIHLRQCIGISPKASGLTDHIVMKGNYGVFRDKCKKIIATTDPELNSVKPSMLNPYGIIGLPRPSNDFLQAYCKAGGIDEVLIEMTNVTDIHTASAAKNLGIHYSEVTREQRTKQKVLNFEALYTGKADFFEFFIIKVAPDNTITIRPLEESKVSWTREEVISLIKEAVAGSHDYSRANNDLHSRSIIEGNFLNDWLKQNL